MEKSVPAAYHFLCMVSPAMLLDPDLFTTLEFLGPA